MATYLTLTSTTSKYLETLPKFDEAYLDINGLRARPEMKSPAKMPVVDIKPINVSGTKGDILVDVYRPSNSEDTVLPALIYM